MVTNDIWQKTNVGIVDVISSMTLLDRITLIDLITQSNMYGKTGDATFQSPRIDVITHHLITLTDAHHHIHDESSFTAFYARTTAATDGHRSGLYIKTPAGTKKGHLIASFSASTGADLTICEAPTIAANVGTHANVIFNRDRNSIIESIMLDNASSPAANKFTTLDEAEIAADGTFALGTCLRQEPLTIGSGPKPAGGGSRGSQEYVLKVNTPYIFLLTNTAASANDHLIVIDYYEHEDKSP